MARRTQRWGIDRFDEVWDGVLHVPPTPSTPHQDSSSSFTRFFAGREALGLEMLSQAVGLSIRRRAKNYRTPDLVVVAPNDVSERGIDGHAELVVEVLSPNDESREKFPFYAARQIPEYWIVDPKTREIEVYVLRGRHYFAVAARIADGIIHAPRLGLELRVVDGPKLRITWADGSAEI